MGLFRRTFDHVLYSTLHLHSHLDSLYLMFMQRHRHLMDYGPTCCVSFDNKRLWCESPQTLLSSPPEVKLDVEPDFVYQAPWCVWVHSLRAPNCFQVLVSNCGAMFSFVVACSPQRLYQSVKYIVCCCEFVVLHNAPCPAKRRVVNITINASSQPNVATDGVVFTLGSSNRTIKP